MPTFVCGRLDQPFSLEYYTKVYCFQFNASMRIHERILKPVFGSCLASLFGRKTPKAVDNFFKAVDHHKGTKNE